MIAVDSNLLAYAHREDSSWHAAAFDRLVELTEGRADAPVRQVAGRNIEGCAFVSREHLAHPVGDQSIAVDGRSALVSSAVSRKVTERLDLVRDGLLRKNGRPSFSTKSRGQKLPRSQHPWL
jgi:hypothetical protein